MLMSVNDGKTTICTFDKMFIMFINTNRLDSTEFRNKIFGTRGGGGGATKMKPNRATTTARRPPVLSMHKTFCPHAHNNIITSVVYYNCRKCDANRIKFLVRCRMEIIAVTPFSAVAHGINFIGSPLNYVHCLLDLPCSACNYIYYYFFLFVVHSDPS